LLTGSADAIAAGVFAVHLDNGSPVSDSGLLAAMHTAMVPMLYAYMQALRDQLRYQRWFSNAVRSAWHSLSTDRLSPDLQPAVVVEAAAAAG
jgi:hypothetical protein